METKDSLKALDRLAGVHDPEMDYCNNGNQKEDYELCHEDLKAFYRLKKAIEWRKKSYVKELETGRDGDGKPLTEANRMIIMNLYNITLALEYSYKEEEGAHTCTKEK